MYVCVCHGVNEKMIREACQGGSRSLKELSRELGIARSCGKCRDHAVQTIESCHTELAEEMRPYADAV